MASISRDSHTVWPSAVRHVGRCWLIAFPAGFLKTFAKQYATPRTRSRRLYLKEIRLMLICFTKDFEALP
jgi:hypothetical protein